MFQSARIDHVHRLHHFGFQLSVLRRLYNSYNLIIERLTTGPQTSTLKPNGDAPMHFHTGDSNRSNTGLEEKPYGVPISTAAAVRFERLKDRISLYALSEIRACLEEKDALMTLVRAYGISPWR